jgi:hypothetical protein
MPLRLNMDVKDINTSLQRLSLLSTSSYQNYHQKDTEKRRMFFSSAKATKQEWHVFLVFSNYFDIAAVQYKTSYIEGRDLS